MARNTWVYQTGAIKERRPKKKKKRVKTAEFETEKENLIRGRKRDLKSSHIPNLFESNYEPFTSHVGL